MHPAFFAASAWSATCSAIGASVAHLVTGCPACALTCPAVACHCTAGPALSCAAAGFPWSIALAAFLGGFLAALAVAWRLRVWAAGGWDVAGRFTLGCSDGGAVPVASAAAAAPAPGAFLPALAPSAPLPALRRIAGAAAGLPPLPSVGSPLAALGFGAVDELAVWKPRVR